MNSHHKIRAVLTLLILAGALLTPVLASTRADAHAPAIPTGTDCLRPPNPASPTSGLASWIDPGPERPPTGDPFDPTSGTSLYDVYGYAGYDAIIYDPGCFDSSRLWDAPNEAANAMTSLGAASIAVAVKGTRTIMQGDFGSLWVPLQRYALDFLGQGIFWPLLGLSVFLTGLVILSRSRRGDVAGETRASAGAAVIILAAALAIGYGVSIGASVDSGVTGVFTAANQVMSKKDNGTVREPGDAVAANLVGQVLYQTWANETFGGNEKVAREYGPRLFAAGALTRAEQRQIDTDPAKAASIRDTKKAQYKAIAKEIETKYPQAYTHLAGNDTRNRAGYAFAGLIGALAGVGYLIYALVKMIWAMVITRVGIGLTPLVALVAQMPRWQHLAMELLTWMVEAVAKAAAFGFLFVVFLVGGIGGIMDPATTWHPLVKAAALIMASVAMHKLLKRLGLIGEWKAPRLSRPHFGASRAAPPATSRVGTAAAGARDLGDLTVTSARAARVPREAMQTTRRLSETAAHSAARKALPGPASPVAAVASRVHPAGPAVLALGQLATAATGARALPAGATRALPGTSRGQQPWRPSEAAAPNRAWQTRRVLSGTVVDDRRLYRPPNAATRAVTLYRPQGATS